MKKIVLAAAAYAALAGVSAMAADLPETIVEPVSVPSFSWTGAYIGGTVGYGFGASNDVKAGPGTANTVAAFASGSSPRRIGVDPTGIVFGAQVGYNYQFDNSPFVIGLEADLQFPDINDRSTRRTSVPGFANNISRGDLDIDWLGTVRGRIGFTPVDRALVYVTGGLAYGYVDLKYSTAYPALGQRLKGRSNGWEYGWTVGGGVEYAVTDNWSLKGEYLYYDLGEVKARANTNGALPAGTFARAKANANGHVVKVGLNYRFNW